MPLGAGGQDDRVVAGAQVAQIGDRLVAAEDDALGLQLLDAAVDHDLLELEVGDAVAQQAARAVVALVHRHGVPDAAQLLGRREAGGSRADDGHGAPALGGGRPRDDPALVERAVGDRHLDLLDGDRVVVQRQHARLLAGRGAELAGELGEVVRGVELLGGFAPPAALDEVVPVGDQVPERAAGVAERHAAVHAPARLVAHQALVGRAVDVAPVATALVDRAVRRDPALQLEEPARVGHAVTAAASSTAWRARRRSCGSTWTKASARSSGRGQQPRRRPRCR